MSRGATATLGRFFRSAKTATWLMPALRATVQAPHPALCCEPVGRLKRELLWFCVAGVIGFGVDVSVLLALVGGLGLGAYLARVLSFVAAATATWLVNRGVTFAATRTDGAKRSVAGEWARYLLAMTVGGAMNFGVYATIVNVWGQAWPVLVAGVVAGTAVGMGFNFLASRHWVFTSERHG